VPSSRRILVIEDNGEGREALVALFECRGHSVSVAPDGRTGVRIALAERPDLILVDIVLPDIDGAEVMREIRLHMPSSESQIVAYSGDHTAADRAREAGCDAFVLKPGVEALESLLDAFAAPRKAPQSAQTRRREDVA
jgi:two-component system, sensor histidine kinase